MKYKNHMIISTQKKHLTESNPFIITLNKLGIERNFLDLIKNIYQKQTNKNKAYTANIILNTFSRILDARQDIRSHHLYSTLYWRFQPKGLGKEKTEKAHRWGWLGLGGGVGVEWRQLYLNNNKKNVGKKAHRLERNR